MSPELLNKVFLMNLHNLYLENNSNRIIDLLWVNTWPHNTTTWASSGDQNLWPRINVTLSLP